MDKIVRELAAMSIEEFSGIMARVNYERQRETDAKVQQAVIDFIVAYNNLIQTVMDTGYSCNVCANGETSYLTFIERNTQKKEVNLYTFEGAENQFGDYEPNLAICS